MFQKLGAIHNYNVSKEDCFKIFGPPKYNTCAEPGNDCQIFIRNIPGEYEDLLLALMLTFKNLYKIKFLKKKNKGMAFIKFTKKECMQKALIKLKSITKHLNSKILARTCEIEEKKLYIGNINISRYPLYKMEQTLLNLVKGLQSYTVYSLDKYNRYIITLMFFTVEDLLLSTENAYEIFAQSPEIFIDTKQPTRIFESVPICSFSYKSFDENCSWPNEIKIFSKKYNELKIF